MAIASLAGNYFLHYITAKRLNATNAPDIPEAIREAIRNSHYEDLYQPIEALRSKLLRDECVITITDLGAGSRTNNKKQKHVSQIARHSLKPVKLAQLIHRLAAAARPDNIIELGTCLGITTAYLSAAAPNAKVTSIEGCPNTAVIAKENLAQLNVTNITVLTGNFDDVLPDVIADAPKLDFVYVDGNHREDATLNYFHQCMPKVHSNTLLIFDDIYWSVGMKNAWKQIQEHPQVSLTIDLFWIGLVMFKPLPQKAHYKVRL